jgi:hypothetical protein
MEKRGSSPTLSPGKGQPPPPPYALRLKLTGHTPPTPPPLISHYGRSSKIVLFFSNFSRIWAVSISVLAITIAIIGFGISLLLLKNCEHGSRNSSCEATEEEAMELVPHITLNPSFNIDMLEYFEAGEPPHQSDLNHLQPGGGGGGGEEEDEEGEGDEINLVNSPSRRNLVAQSGVGGGGGGHGSPSRPNG